MNTTAMQESGRVEGAAAQASPWHEPRYQAFALLWIGFSAAPILFGLDKFFDVLVDWPIYLAPWVNDIAPGSAQDFMYVVGAVEIVGVAKELGMASAAMDARCEASSFASRASCNTPHGSHRISEKVFQ